MPPTPGPYWLQPPVGQGELIVELLLAEPFPLTCTSTSTFTGSTDVRPGTYDVWVVAVQSKETNAGFARTTLVVT